MGDFVTKERDAEESYEIIGMLIHIPLPSGCR